MHYAARRDAYTAHFIIGVYDACMLRMLRIYVGRRQHLSSAEIMKQDEVNISELTKEQIFHIVSTFACCDGSREYGICLNTLQSIPLISIDYRTRTTEK